jgi:HD-GYP domain-containing protein (c-di-GMP phosphodiesterase class II)
LRAKLTVSRLRATATRRLLVMCGLETGRRLGLAEEDLRNLSYALHHYDLGLAEVSPHILTKPGPLDTNERAQVCDHVSRGVDLASQLEAATAVTKILEHHHENVDGSGYPHGSRGEAIPVGARIVRLVDTFCAVVDARPYRSARTAAAAVEELRAGIGRAYCPRVTPVFLSVLADRWDTIQEHVESKQPQGGIAAAREIPVPVGVVEDR